MKKYILPLLLIFFVFAGLAQNARPTYIDIIKTFSTTYQTLEDYDNYTKFAKKKDGWYVIQVNQIQSDKLLSEKLFYSFSENKYFDLSADYSTSKEENVDKQLEKYLNFGGSTSDWYAFEHIAYYGYNGWYDDMINDFADQQNLSDTLYDGLGRAYANLALNYLWYQNGGIHLGNDTLQRKLERLEYPSAQRILKTKEAIDNAIRQFEKLRKINPVYKTVVGNSILKLFNECMLGYNQMIMCGNDLLTKEYLEKASLPEPYIIQAKNYLNSCDPNTILFSYGDNDTYQLWYVQEKYNFRKDVLVINNSLLGLPVYIDMFKRKKILAITIPDSYLKDQAGDIVYFSENKKIADVKKVIPLKDFLNIIYTKKYSTVFSDNNSYSTYPYSSASLTLPVTINKTTQTSVQKNIVFNLSKNYYFLNDIATLDIISNNISKRQVCFTSLIGNYFEKNIMQKGIVYKLITEDINLPVQNNLQVKELEKFINEKYIPVLSNNKDLTSFDGDNTFFNTYYTVFNYYLEKKDTISLKKWLGKLDAACPKINNTQINIAKNLAYYFIEVGNIKKGLDITNQHAQWLYEVYSKPSSLNGYYFKENYRDELTKMQKYLASKNLNSTIIDSLLEKLDD